METKAKATLSSDQQMNDFECFVCPKCYFSTDIGDVLQQLTNLPAGVKFDPTDVELLDHLAAKCGIGNLQSNMFIDNFIITLQGEGGICYTHPENLPGTKKDGSNAHFFYKSMNAYASGKRKRRKIQSEDCVRWHKTGKTKAVVENGVTKGYKKILVLYTTRTKGCKSDKSNWVMHQYHLGHEDSEKEGEYVVSKVFYQQKHVKKADNTILGEDSVHPKILCPKTDEVSSPNKQEDTNTHDDFKEDIVRTPAQEMEVIKNIPETSSPGSQSKFEMEVPSWFAAESTSETAGTLYNNLMDAPLYSDFFAELQYLFPEDQNPLWIDDDVVTSLWK